jgi:peroxiredoxin
MLRVGSNAPDFKLRLDSGELLRLQALKGRQPVVLLFLPHENSVDVEKEGYALLHHLQEAEALGAKVVAISPSKLEALYRFAELYRVPLATGQDESRDVCRSYQVMWLGGSAVRRTTYVIDAEGVIRACLHHDLLPEKHWSSIARALRSLNGGRGVPHLPEGS